MRESLRFADSSCGVCDGTVWRGTARGAVGSSDRGGDGAVADDRLAVHQHRGLAGRGGVEGLGELQLERLVASRRGRADAGGQGGRVVAEADVVDPGALAVEDRVADADVARLDVLAG